jgi:hypothetical protein
MASAIFDTRTGLHALTLTPSVYDSAKHWPELPKERRSFREAVTGTNALAEASFDKGD